MIRPLEIDIKHDLKYQKFLFSEFFSLDKEDKGFVSEIPFFTQFSFYARACIIADWTISGPSPLSFYLPWALSKIEIDQIRFPMK